MPLNSKKAEQIIPYLSWIRFSVDAGTPETYSEVHGTKKEDFQKALRNIEYSVKLKQENNLPVTIGVQVLLTNKSLNEIHQLAQIVKEIDADNIQIKPYSHHPASKNDLSFDFNEAEKIREKLENLSDKNFQVIYRTKTIERLYNGRDYTAWNGKKRKDVLEKINQTGIDNCRLGCRLDTINLYLERLKNPKEHDNFI